jgi:hypothetical protein
VHTTNNSEFPTSRNGRPRHACNPCNNAKVKCEPGESGGPCKRCAKKGIVDCTDRFEVASTAKPVSAISLSEDLDNVDLTDLIEASLKVYNVPAEEWKRIIIESPSRW